MSDHSVPPAPTKPAWAGPVAVALLALGMLAWTWGGWADPVVDFGREVYVPWRLAAGERLYQDLAYQYGPLSPYLNAGCFLFASTWWPLLLFNLAQVALLLVVLYILTARLAGAGAAVAVGGLTACLFAFAQLGPLGSFNFVTPYTHAATHGVLLALLTLGALGGYLREPRVGWAGAVGAGLGLTFLTKPEAFLAALAAVVTGGGLCWWRERASRGRILREGSTALVASLVPPLIAWGLLTLSMPVDVAWRGTLGSWAHAQNEPLRDLVAGHFYAVGAGTDAPLSRLGTLLIWSLGYAAALSPCALAAWRLPAAGKRTRQAAVLSVLTLGALGILAGPLLRGPGWATPLPLAVACLTALEVRRLRRLGDPTATPATALRAAWGALSLGFLLKMLLNARLTDYGFTLALPGSAFCAAALIGWWPTRLERNGRGGRVLRAASSALLVVLVVQQLVVMRGHLQTKTERLGVRPEESLRVDARGKALQGLLTELALRVRPDETLLVLPEGALLNYLLRRRVPTHGVTFVPTTVLLLGGEQQVVADLRARPPDYVVYLHRDTAEYGPELRHFGRDYGQAVDAWVREAYEPLLRIGADPFQRDAFGVLLWERRR